MKQRFSFAQQFFAVSSTIPEGRALLAGGLYPLRGSRSAYQASVACYDYAAGRVVWHFDKTKSYPFRAVAHTRGVCAAILPQNFVRCPQGMFRFDAESGAPISPDADVRGWKLEFVDATAEAFLFSWVCDDISLLRAVDARGAAFEQRTFPYRSTSGGKTIERVIAGGNETFVAVFSLVADDQVVYSIEQWSLTSASPGWEKRTSLKHVVRNGSVLMLWGCSGPNLDVEILSIESGNALTCCRLPVANVVSIQPIDADSYAVLSISGVHIIHAASKTVSQVMGIGPSDFLDFGALAVDSSLGKLIVVTAGNHQRPGTHLLVLDL